MVPNFRQSCTYIYPKKGLKLQKYKDLHNDNI